MMGMWRHTEVIGSRMHGLAIWAHLLCLLGVVSMVRSCPAGCACTGTTEAVCSDQGITSLATVVDHLPQGLYTLQLSRNNLSVLEPGAFSSANTLSTTLRTLDLSSNNITMPHAEALYNLTQLERLDLSNNPLVELPAGLFRDLDKLTELILSDVGLKRISRDLFRGLSRLQRLDLSLNRLAVLPRGLLSGLPELAWLSLAANGLRGMPRAEFQPLEGLQSLQLGGNPWECNCSLVELKHWLEWMLYRGGQVDSLECSTPRELWGRDIRTVPAEMFSHCLPRGGFLPCPKGPADGGQDGPGGAEGSSDCVRQRYRAVSVRRAAATVAVAGVVCGVVCVMMVVAATYGCVYASLAAKYQKKERKRKAKGKKRKLTLGGASTCGGEEKGMEAEEKSELLPDVAKTKVAPPAEVVLSREVCV